MGSAAEVVLQEWASYAPWAELTVAHGELSVLVSGRRPTWSIVGWPEFSGTSVGPGQILVADSLGRRLRTQLVNRAQPHADRRVLHLVGDGVLVHLERDGQPEGSTDRPRPATDSLPPSGVRAVQAMLARNDLVGGWTVRRLADEVDLSVGQAHRILAILEQADLVTSSAGRPSGSRRVRDRGELLDWLAQQPVARRAPRQWTAHVYGRDGREVLTRAADGLSRVTSAYAVSGMAAASLAELGPTAVTIVHIWMSREADLTQIVPASGMRHVSRGANVVLWSDIDGSGAPSTERIDGISVAQPPRVYLDLLRLPRGPEVAQTYRRVQLGY